MLCVNTTEVLTQRQCAKWYVDGVQPNRIYQQQISWYFIFRSKLYRNRHVCSMFLKQPSHHINVRLIASAPLIYICLYMVFMVGRARDPEQHTQPMLILIPLSNTVDLNYAYGFV